MSAKSSTKTKKNFTVIVDGDKTSPAKGENLSVKELNSLLSKGIATKTKRKALVSFLNTLNTSNDTEASEIVFNNPIYKTWDYEKFKKIKGNRKVKDSKIVKLGKSIAEGVNLMPYCPVLVDKNYNICDGQHRFETAKSSGLPVFYMIINDMALEDIATMNSNSHSWTVSDYLNLYKELGKEDYIYLDNFVENQGYALSTCLELFSNSERSTQSKFKTGDFKISKENKKFANRVVEICSEFSQYNSTFTKKRAFVRAVVALVRKEEKKEDYSQIKMMTKMKEVEGKLMFTEQLNPENYLRMFEAIYNYRRSSGKIRLY